MRLGALRYATSVDGVDATDDQYRLEKNGERWTVYYSERGKRLKQREFFYEEEACDYFLEWVRNDPTVWRRT